MSSASSEPQSILVSHEETGELFKIDIRDAQSWDGALDYEGWMPVDDFYEWTLIRTLYRTASGEWFLVTERSHYEWSLADEARFRQLTDQEAADWIFLNCDTDPPPELLDLIEGRVLGRRPMHSAVDVPGVSTGGERVPRPDDHDGAVRSSVDSPAKDSSRKPPMSSEIADTKGQALVEILPDPTNVSQREWASKIGCSHGLIRDLPFYRKLHHLPPPKPRHRLKAVPYIEGSTEFAAATADDDWQAEIDERLDRDEELRRLAREQAADAEPSPLEASARRVKVRRRP